MIHLSEAVAKRTAGKYGEFPEEPDLDKIEEFLKWKGFTKSAKEYSLGTSPFFSNENGDRYCKAIGSNGDPFLVFKDEKDNRFLLEKSPDGVWVFILEGKRKGDRVWNEYESYEMFRDIVVRHFGWD